jgi:hypothetical protein
VPGDDAGGRLRGGCGQGRASTSPLTWREGHGAAAGGHGGRGKGGGNGEGGGTGKGKGKEEAGGEDDKGAVRTALELAVLKAADLFQAERLLKHYLEGFRSGLSVHKVVEQLVWVHKDGPAEARTVATEFLLTHSSVIRVCCCRLACFIDDVSGGRFWR